MKLQQKRFCGLKKYFIVISAVVLALYVGEAFADGSGGVTDLKSLVTQITSSFQSLGELMAATAYLAGFGMTIAAIFKFKQHKDNPTQIPMGTAIALLVVGIVLIFLPGVVGPAGTTIFGSKADTLAGGYTGQGAKQLPGGNT
jgi:intracellular multiplication protein IcmD